MVSQVIHRFHGFKSVTPKMKVVNTVTKLVLGVTLKIPIIVTIYLTRSISR